VRGWLLQAVWAILTAALLHAQTIPGERIYREGALPDGRLLEARVNGDIPLRGQFAACAGCHRRSGYGLADSEMLASSITGETLFSAREPRRADLLQGLYQEVHSPTSWAGERTPKLRPAYTGETLAVALRTGLDPSGRLLDPAMPRYALDQASAKALVAYLETLGTDQAPGVDAKVIQFATVIAGQVSLDRERAMLGVMEAFINAKNLDTLRESARPDFSPYYKGEYRSSWRRWSLNVWRLRGDPVTWERQLTELQASRPVFAVLGGLAEGGWQPIHAFCERNGLPCLFPNTDLPVVDAPSHDTLYLSRGLIGEAEATAEFLHEQQEDARVVQVLRNDPAARGLADEFSVTLAKLGSGEPWTRLLPADDVPTSADWTRLAEGKGATALAVWLGPDDPAWRTLAQAKLLMPVHGSGGLLLADVPAASRDLPAGLRLSYPYSLPGKEAPQIYRVRAWLEARHVRTVYERLQLNTYFTMSVTEHALIHMAGHFSRDYLIESVEHETENALDPGTFPSMSLGPEGRYASKGSYIVTLDAMGTVRPASSWIVWSP